MEPIELFEPESPTHKDRWVVRECEGEPGCTVIERYVGDDVITMDVPYDVLPLLIKALRVAERTIEPPEED